MSEKSTVIYGLDEEYQNIDIAELKDGGSEEFQIVPTPDRLSPDSSKVAAELSPDTLVFLDSTASSTEVTGPVDITTQQFQEGSEWGSMRHRRTPGKAASYLESKGFGWLLDIEEEEEDAKPLL